jgi:hypothetical protein
MSKEYSPQETPPEMQNRVTYKRITVVPVAGSNGINWNATVPANKRWEVLSLSMDFQTSAVVANRQVNIFITVSGIALWSDIAPSSQPANTHYFYNFAQNTQRQTVVNSIVVSTIPKIILNAGAVINHTMGFRDAGDGAGDIFLWVREIDIA